MKVLKQSNQEVLRLLGGTQIRTKARKYRMNKYCLEHKLEDGVVLIHNCFTGAEVMIKPFEYINIFTNSPCDYADFLLMNYFIVPEDYNEEEMVHFVRMKQQKPIPSNYLDHPHKFIILTTTRCNARCFYCYEMNSKNKTHMTYETAEKVANYILEVVPKDHKVELNWFGGEPLFNVDVIEIICSRLASAGINFTSSMISNSYLFDDEMVEKAVNEWRLKNIQVTFDGTEEVYNKIKNYIYKDGESPYYKVIGNVKRLLNNKITVSVRMNCDHHNAENLKELIKELDSHFKGEGNFSMYVWPLFEIGFVRTPEEKKALYESVLELDKLLLDLGYPMSHKLPEGIKGIHCMADSGDAVTISPRGDLGVCEHYVDKDFIGHIDRPYEKNFDIIRSWREYTPATELCSDCPLYPTCLRMKGCPDEKICDEYQKIYWIEHYKLDLLSNYIMSKCSCGDKCENPKN